MAPFVGWCPSNFIVTAVRTHRVTWYPGSEGTGCKFTMTMINVRVSQECRIREGVLVRVIVIEVVGTLPRERKRALIHLSDRNISPSTGASPATDLKPSSRVESSITTNDG